MMRRATGLLASVLCAASPLLHAAVTCTVTATAVQFGTYDPLSAAPLLSTGTVVTTCTLRGALSAQATLTSSFTTGSSGKYAGRTMTLGANSLLYNLYLDAAHTQIAGNGTGGSSTGGATLNLNFLNSTQTWTETIYGNMPASQDAAPGTYMDSIMVTIDY
jgi:spore coat protein U-like protein